MDKFKFIKGLYTEDVVVNKPHTELAVDINGNVITAGQKNNKDFQDQILRGVNDNSAPLKIYTVTGEMLTPEATLSKDRKSLILNGLICKESSREGNALPADVKSSFEKLSNYKNKTLKFNGNRTWNVDGDVETLCELQLNNGESYNKNAILKAGGQLTKHSFDLVENGPADGTFYQGVTFNAKTFNSGAFKDGQHYDDAKKYKPVSLIESDNWSDIESGIVWKCKAIKDSVLYSVSTDDEISASGDTLDLDLTEKIKSRKNFEIRKYTYTNTETKYITLSGNTVAPTYVNLGNCTLVEANELLQTSYSNYEIVEDDDCYKVKHIESKTFYPLYGTDTESVLGIKKAEDPEIITLSKTYNLDTPVYKYSESITFSINENYVYTKKDDDSIISAPSGSKILKNGQLISNVEGEISSDVYDSDVQLIEGSVYKGSTEDTTFYYSMSDSVVSMSDENYKFSGDNGNVINKDRILYTTKGDITFSVSFVD